MNNDEHQEEIINAAQARRDADAILERGRRASFCSADEIIAVIEESGFGWSLDHTGRLIEARIWDWPNVIGRYRPSRVEPLALMLTSAIMDIPPSKRPAIPKQND